MMELDEALCVLDDLKLTEKSDYETVELRVRAAWTVEMAKLKARENV